MTSFGYGILFGYILGVFSGPVLVFLVAYLFSHQADARPSVVLGRPRTGKAAK